MQKKIYFENLNGLRFFAFLSVFLYHSFYTESTTILSNPVYHFVKKDLFGNGNIGVNFFFVLSGFLITYLLIEEKNMNKQIDLPKFYLRRILRIWPLFYFCVFFGFIIFPAIKSWFGLASTETANPLYYLVFLNNFDIIKSGLPDASILGILWSIAIEEQFYLVWPVILFVFPVRKLWIPFICVIFISLGFRAYHDSILLNDVHTIACIGDMAIGALGAWLVINSQKVKQSITELRRYQIIIIYLVFTFCFLFRDEFLLSSQVSRIFERSLIAITALLIILEQCFAKRSFFKMSGFKTASRMGVISYGLYCLHFIGILSALRLTKFLPERTLAIAGGGKSLSKQLSLFYLQCL